MNQPPIVPPGWHPDPWQQAAARWWDGSAWSGHAIGRADARMFATTPTVSTVLYAAAGRLLAPSRNPLAWFQAPGGGTVNADELIGLVFGSAFWSLREQGAIWLAEHRDDGRRRARTRARVGLARMVERPALSLEGAILRALGGKAPEGVDLRELLASTLHAGDLADSAPVKAGDLMWAPHAEGAASGLLAVPEKPLGTHSKVALARPADARAEALRDEWRRFEAAEPALAQTLTRECVAAFGEQNAPDL